MNKKFFTMMLVAVMTTSVAQAQFHAGMRGGLNVSSMYGKTVPYIADGPGVEGRIGYQIGAVGELAMGRVFAVQPALLFATAGYTSRSKAGLEESEMLYQLNYLQVPLNALIKLPLGQKAGIFLYLGPYGGYALNGKFKVNEFEDRKVVKTETTKVIFNKEAIKRFDAGAGFGLGFQAGAVQFDLGMTIGLMNIHNLSGHEMKNNNLALTVSYFLGK